MAVVPLGVVGTATGFATDTVVVPVGLTVPRTDPVLGSTYLLVTAIVDDHSSISTSMVVSDDAATDPFYNTCLFTDGLNHYDGPAPFGASAFGMIPTIGMITNPLTTGNSITVVSSIVQDYLFVIVTGFTGVSCNYTGPGGFATLADLLPPSMSGTGYGARDLAWRYGPSDNIIVSSYSGPPSFTWPFGDYATYFQLVTNPPSPTGSWAWNAVDITTEYESDDIATGVGTNTYSLVSATEPITTGEVVDLTGTIGGWTAESTLTAQGGSFLAGPGPTCTGGPPPPFSGPVFHHRHRALD